MIRRISIIISRFLFIIILRLLSACRRRWTVQLSPETQKIYFANHGSNLDFPVIWVALPKPFRDKLRPVAARDYWNANPIRRFLSKDVLRAIHIDRVKADRVHENPLLPIEEALDQGFSILIFPEGTRSLTGEIAQFKSGIFHLSQKYPNVELVPLYLHLLNRILPKGEIVPVPFISTMFIGAPLVRTANEDKVTFLTRSREAMVALQKEANVY